MNWYHRKLESNERVIRIELQDNKFATLLFTYITDQKRWVCVMEDETMSDLKNMLPYELS